MCVCVCVCFSTDYLIVLHGWELFPVRDGKYVGNLVWTSIWSEELPHGMDFLTKGRGSAECDQHTHCHIMDEHGESAIITWPRALDLAKIKRLLALLDSFIICQCYPPTTCEISANTEYYCTHGYPLICHIPLPHPSMLVIGLQV